MSGVLADYIDKLKYKDKILLLEINKGEGLNTRVYEIEDTEIYRFVFKDSPQKNHIPPYEHTPKRSTCPDCNADTNVVPSVIIL